MHNRRQIGHVVNKVVKFAIVAELNLVRVVILDFLQYIVE